MTHFPCGKHLPVPGSAGRGLRHDARSGPWTKISLSHFFRHAVPHRGVGRTCLPRSVRSTFFICVVHDGNTRKGEYFCAQGDIFRHLETEKNMPREGGFPRGVSGRPQILFGPQNSCIFWASRYYEVPRQGKPGPKKPMAVPSRGAARPQKAAAKIQQDDARPMPNRLPLPTRSDKATCLDDGCPRPEIPTVRHWQGSLRTEHGEYSGSSPFTKHHFIFACALCSSAVQGISTVYSFFVGSGRKAWSFLRVPGAPSRPRAGRTMGLL